LETYIFNITGKVQHVYYRKAIQQIASAGAIRGYIKNLPDGSVEVVAELFEDQFDDFIMLLNNGSPLSKVEDIEYKILENDDLLYDGFEIR
jgi:acylphosphatase